MPRIFLFLIALLGLTNLKAQTSSKEQWIQLFNGKNLDGWMVKIKDYPAGENFANTFRVVDGKMVVSYDGYDAFKERFGHIFYKQSFGYYRIRVSYRFTGEQVKEGPGWAIRNSGIMLHGQSPQSMGLHQDFPISIEVQLLGGNGKDPRSTCNLCTPGTNVVIKDTLRTAHCINSKSATYHGEQWVEAEVEVLGDSLIRHYVNGGLVLEYNKPQIGGGNVSGNTVEVTQKGVLLSEGYLSLQSESHPVEFRKVELLNLEGCMDPKALNYKSYYLKSRPEDCRYK
jgi:hypothetical protein